MNFAGPQAEIAVMGAKGASEIIFKKEIAEAADPSKKLAPKGTGICRKICYSIFGCRTWIYRRSNRAKDTRIKLIKVLQCLKTRWQSCPGKNMVIFRCNLKRRPSALVTKKHWKPRQNKIILKSLQMRYPHLFLISPSKNSQFLTDFLRMFVRLLIPG
jgi:hypothetical protein